MNSLKPVKGIPWGEGAISTAEWTGVRLTDILCWAGVKDWRGLGIRHVIFEGSDRDMDGSHYEASVPAETAFDPLKEVLVAFRMNGEDIPLDHGFPLRVIIPGTIGARQVKWLKRIILSSEESQSFWQQKDYKTYSPSTDLESADPNKATPIQEFPVQSAICAPTNGALLEVKKGGAMEVKGYAIAGGGRGILRVEISIDGGKTWMETQLTKAVDQPTHKNWAWTLWSVNIQHNDILELIIKSKSGKPSGQIFIRKNPEINESGKIVDLEILCKATDTSHNCQPESDAGIWNPRGLLSNKWHRIHVRVHLE